MAQFCLLVPSTWLQRSILQGTHKWYQSLMALDLGLIRWQQSGRSEGSRVSSQTLTSKHMDWFTAGLDVPTAKLFLIPIGKLMVIAGSSWFLLVVPAGFHNWYQSLVALDLGLIRWQQSGRSEGSRVSSQTLTSKHMDWFTAGLDVPTAKLFLIPTSKLMVPAGSSWFLLVVPAGRLCGSYWSVYGFFCLPYPILFVIAASIIGPQTPLDLEQ
ncbi:hypothetical protein Tco_1130882 [Tanacetum coccineum]